MDGRDNMIHEYLNGSTVINIAKKYGVTREAVYLRLRRIPGWRNISYKKRVAKRGSYLKQYKDLMPQIVELINRGIYRRDIARQLNMPYLHLKQLLRGTKHDKAHTARMPIHNNLRRDYGRGMSRQELMKKYGFSYPHVCRIIKKYNIK